MDSQATQHLHDTSILASWSSYDCFMYTPNLSCVSIESLFHREFTIIILYSVLHQNVFWYSLNGIGFKKNASKKVFLTFFGCIFSTITKWNSLQILQKQISRYTNVCFPKDIEYRLISDSQLQPWEGFGCR